MAAMRKLAVILLLLAGPAAAEEQARPEDLAREGAAKLMRALELFLETLPRYEAPRVLPNGDILIPRAPRPEGGEGERREGGPEESETLRT